MSLTDRDRHDAYEALVEAFGDKTDSVIAMSRTDTTEILTKDEFRVAMAGIDTEFARMRVEFKAEINEAFRAQTRTLVIGLVGAFLLTAMTNVLTLVLG